MTTPPFVFDHRTGVLHRGGKEIALCRLHADMFMSLASAQTPIGDGAIGKAINMPAHAIRYEMPRLAKRLAPLGINIASNQGRYGRWLEFEAIPKWKPKIAPPAIVPGNPPW